MRPHQRRAIRGFHRLRLAFCVEDEDTRGGGLAGFVKHA